MVGYLKNCEDLKFFFFYFLVCKVLALSVWKLVECVGFSSQLSNAALYPIHEFFVCFIGFNQRLNYLSKNLIKKKIWRFLVK